MYVNAGETYGWESEDFWCDEGPVVSKDFFQFHVNCTHVNAGETYGWDSEDCWYDEGPLVSRVF